MAEPTDVATDLSVVRMLRADAPSADPARLVAGRRALMDAMAAETATGKVSAADTTARPPFRHRRCSQGSPATPRLVRRTLLAAVTAAAVTAGVFALRPGLPAVTRPGSTARPQTVATVLAAAALTAEQHAAQVPGPDQWVYVAGVACEATCSDRVTWYRGDGRQWAFSGPDHRVVVRDEDGPKKTPSRYTDDLPRTYRELSRLPSEPHALLEALARDPFFQDTSASMVRIGKNGLILGRGPVPPPALQVAAILGILEHVPAVPPRVGAALFRALAQTPNARLLGRPIKDAMGRPGVAVEFTTPGEPAARQYLIMDPRTHAYLGSRQDWPGSPASSAYARTATGIVSHPGRQATPTAHPH
ncbi:CU044_5270 family protein [Streptomyces sp. NPDC001380]|uniref:CU044_5270 family protein n=1 Tax=Streptomyces sp. NPDC001380 TaxID=3364566 RepID=UPI0036874EFF